MKKKNKKVKKMIPKGEYLFNIISFSLIIILGIYIGYRSIYFYSKQKNKDKKEINTLAATVIKSNKLTKTSNGFHQEKDGYLFKGIVDNNYVVFSNQVFRIMKVYNNNSVKIITENTQGTLIYGDSSSYKDSNLYNFLNKTTKKNSGTFYDSVASPTTLLTQTKWCETTLTSNDAKCSKEKKDYVTTLSTIDYANALGKNSYLNTGKNVWLSDVDKDNNNLYINSDGDVDITTNYEGYGVRAIITLAKNITITKGSGTKGDPYVIDQKGNDTYYNKYVKLGDDIWKIYKDEDETLRLSLNDYLKVKDKYLETTYSRISTLYNPLDRSNIAYYLNRTYYNSLSYKLSLSECVFATGEVSTTKGFDYENIYSNSISNKVGLLNIFDLNNNTTLTNYFLMNKTASSTNMAFVYNTDNSLQEAKITDKLRVVPTICLSKSLIKSGDGSIENPYSLE